MAQYIVDRLSMANRIRILMKRKTTSKEKIVLELVLPESSQYKLKLLYTWLFGRGILLEMMFCKKISTSCRAVLIEELLI